MHQRQHSWVWLWFTLDTAIASVATLCCLWGVYTAPRAVAFSTVLSERLSVKNFLLLLLFLIFWTGIHQLVGLCKVPLNGHWRSLALRVAFASALGSVFFLLFPLFSHQHDLPQHVPVLVFFAVAFAGSLLVRSALLPLLPRIADAQYQRSSRTLIVGTGPIAARLFYSLDPPSRQSIFGFIDSPGPHASTGMIGSLLLGDFDDLERLLMSTAIDEVLIALPLRSCYDQVKNTIEICERAGVPVSYSLQPFSHTLGFAQVQQRARQHYLSWRPSRVEQSTVSKRIIDLIGSSAAIVLLSPLFILIALAIKLSGPGPVFFVQERYGLYKQRFRMFKFRTMVPDAEARQASLEHRNEAQGPVFKMKNDPRVTPLGRFLRKASLDELPQLFNVLRGEMSLVGPRPLPNRDVARFNDPWLMRRFSVKPGLTCLWQVQGRSDTNFEQWIAYDLEYIDTWSPLLDCKILLMTIPAVVRGSGAM